MTMPLDMGPFSIECRKIGTKSSFWPIKREADNPVDQSKLKENTSRRREKRENVWGPVMTTIMYKNVGTNLPLWLFTRAQNKDLREIQSTRGPPLPPTSHTMLKTGPCNFFNFYSMYNVENMSPQFYWPSIFHCVGLRHMQNAIDLK